MRHTRLAFVGTVTSLLAGIVFSLAAAAQTFTILHTFKDRTDGASPYSGLVFDAAGNLYGTTPFGGAHNFGTVFKVASPNMGGTESVLYSFTGGTDGARPYGSLVGDSAGNFYGTTLDGGDLSCRPPHGCGVVFKLDAAGNQTVLYTFTGGADGAQPYAGLIRDKAGNLYGTTLNGGLLLCHGDHHSLGCGVVFELDAAGHQTVLHNFGFGNDGVKPDSQLVRDAAGNLYGTTLMTTQFAYGAEGVAFKIDASGVETVLSYFDGGFDGANPYGGLLRDSAGNLYGTSRDGGLSNYGTVFKLDSSGTQTVLHNFSAGTNDGARPYAGLVHDTQGNFYGTATIGGFFSFGTVFKLDAAGNFTILYSFTGGADGGIPYGNLILDAAGNLYGTALISGFDHGVVFKIAPLSIGSFPAPARTRRRPILKSETPLALPMASEYPSKCPLGSRAAVPRIAHPVSAARILNALPL